MPMHARPMQFYRTSSIAEKRFLQVSLFLPLVFPIVLAIVGVLLGLRVPPPGPRVLDNFLFTVNALIGFSVFVGGIPYIAFLIGLFV
jgi:hypothetical protein